MTIQNFKVDGAQVQVDVPDDTSLLWVLRDKLGYTGPKYGCGINVCKACTCLVDGKAFTPCATHVSTVSGHNITTIQGLAGTNADGSIALHPVQQAWLDLDVAQCGYCQAGWIMATVDLLKRTANNPTDADIDAMQNVCRCGTYGRIRAAIKLAASRMRGA